MAVLPPGVGTGFTSVGQYLDANQGTLAREGEQIGSDVGGRIDAAHGAADQLIAGRTEGDNPDYTTLPGYTDALDKAIAAKDQATALGSSGGLSDYFQKNLRDSRSQGDFDAQLLGASGRLDTAGLQGRASGLIDYLNQGLAKPLPAAPIDTPGREDVDRNTGGAAGGQPGRAPSPRPPGYQVPALPPPSGPRRPRTGPTMEF